MPETVDDILNRALDTTDGQSNYANHARINIGLSDATIDFYMVGANPNMTEAPISKRLYRIVLPLPVAKQLATILFTGIHTIENKLGFEIPTTLEDDNNEDEDDEE